MDKAKVQNSLSKAIKALDDVKSVFADDAALFQELRSSSEEELRQLQNEVNSQVNEARIVGNGTLARILRGYVLAITELADQKQRERYSEYERVSAEANNASVSEIRAEAADAVSVAERIIGGKG